MNDPVNPGPMDSAKATRLSELPRDIAPPRDGWPALATRLSEAGTTERGSLRRRIAALIRPHRRFAAAAVGIAAVLAAVAAGISIDRLLLRSPVAISRGAGPAGAGLAAAYVTDPRYLRERQVLLRSLDTRLASLPPPTRQKVLASLATIHQSMREIQQALGREPGNALLQELLVDTYQDEMRVLTAVQEARAGGGES